MTENVETCTMGKFQSLYYRLRNQSINTKTRRLFPFMFIVCIVKFQPGKNETRKSVQKNCSRYVREKYNCVDSPIVNRKSGYFRQLLQTVINACWLCFQRRQINACRLARASVLGLQMRDFRGTQRQFLENICSEDDLKSRIFGTFLVKFLACLLLLGFSNI